MMEQHHPPTGSLSHRRRPSRIGQIILQCQASLTGEKNHFNGGWTPKLKLAQVGALIEGKQMITIDF